MDLELDVPQDTRTALVPDLLSVPMSEDGTITESLHNLVHDVERLEKRLHLMEPTVGYDGPHSQRYYALLYWLVEVTHVLDQAIARSKRFEEGGDFRGETDTPPIKRPVPPDVGLREAVPIG